jgi:hypothetical protein
METWTSQTLGSGGTGVWLCGVEWLVGDGDADAGHRDGFWALELVVAVVEELLPVGE